MKIINSNDDLLDSIDVVYDEDGLELDDASEKKDRSVRRRIEDLLDKRKYQQLLADFEDDFYD